MLIVTDAWLAQVARLIDVAEPLLLDPLGWKRVRGAGSLLLKLREKYPVVHRRGVVPRQRAPARGLAVDRGEPACGESVGFRVQADAEPTAGRFATTWPSAVAH